MGLWAKGIISILVVWAIGVSLFLALSTMHERDQGDRFWCLEVGLSTLQVGVGHLANTVNDNVTTMQTWEDLNDLLFPEGGGFSPARSLETPNPLLLTFTEPEQSDVLQVCEAQDDMGF